MLRRSGTLNLKRKAPNAALAAVTGFIALALVGCSQSELTGIVQNSKWLASGWELQLGTAKTADYILVERAALLDLEGRVVAAKHPGNIMLLGSQYVGMRISVSGNVERDSGGKRFIKVTRREQIEIR